MAETLVTIAVVPREQFAVAPASLESVLEHTDVPHRLVYIDGKSPRRIRSYLEAQAAMHRFELVRSERYLSPNEARNLALSHVSTKYVAFVDNDAFVTARWLQGLLDCAEETNAWVVGPLCFEGDPKDGIVHIAGGTLALAGAPGKRSFEEKAQHFGLKSAEVGRLQREPCDFVEFHCMLVRTDVFQTIGPLDTELLSSREHLDFCLCVREAGGSIYFEPSSKMTYRKPPPLALSDLPFFMLRWSESWNARSLRHFCEKHGIDPDYANRVRHLRAHRRLVFEPIRSSMRKLFGKRADAAVARVLYGAEQTANRIVFRDRTG